MHLAARRVSALSLAYEAIHRLCAGLARCHARWRQRQALRALDDRLLRDIGLTRAEAEREARKPFWQA
jgi:uncharacterized protein YjiS (DUF1127 family)